jgi:multidrug resistance efflux pump
MENSVLYDTKSIQFIKVLFRIIVVFLVVFIALLFILKMNDTVNFNEGLIYSSNPQVKIKAPNEVKVIKLNVKEGQTVKKNDTLFVLENLKTKIDFDAANLDVTTMQVKIESVNQLISSALDQKKAVEQLIVIQSNIYKTDKSKTEQEIKNLNNKLILSKKQSSDVSERYKTDSILFAKGAISKLELSEQNNKKTEDKKSQSDIYTNYKNKNYDYNNLANNFQKTNNDLRLNIINIDNQIINYKGQIVDLQSQIENKKFSLSYFKDELGKLIVLSPFDGTVSNLFNVKQDLQIVNKDELLTIIAPKNETFYAKVALSEKDLIYVKKGQEVNLKLDAYNYYKYGAIKGNITYVSPSDLDKTFFCIVKFHKYNPKIILKAGYSLRGEVIVEKMKVYQYIIKKLFKSVD